MNDSFTQISKETIFSNSTQNLSEIDDDLVSDKVNILANGIYREFENLIKLHGQGTVDGLMPLFVTILETMDKLYSCKDNLFLQLDLLKEDQCQLYNQYEKEKALKKIAEQKINHLEDQYEEDKQQFENRIESFESNNRLLEMKIKNCKDLITRHEDKEVEMKKEFQILQQRYSELLRTKADQKHRITHSQCATEEVSSGCQSPQFGVKHKLEKSKAVSNLGDYSSNSDEIDSRMGEFLQSQIQEMNSFTLKEELCEDWGNENILSHFDGVVQSMVDGNTVLEFEMNDDSVDNNCSNDNEIPIESDDICDDNGFGMMREIEFLLKENQDLTETKNALNIVKDDLITQVEELTGELIVMREELRNSNCMKKEYKSKVLELEKKVNEISELLKEKDAKLLELGEDDELIECAVDQNGIKTKTKFTRAEVSRILLERNKYKEELLELQETIRYQMTMTKNERAKKGTMWNFFSTLVSNATAFTAEAIIGSGNDVSIAHLNRNLNSITINDETGGYIQLPNLSNQSSSNRKRATPGLPMRISNPFFSPLHDNDQPMVDLVPLDEIEKKSSKRNEIDDSCF